MANTKIDEVDWSPDDLVQRARDMALIDLANPDLLDRQLAQRRTRVAWFGGASPEVVADTLRTVATELERTATDLERTAAVLRRHADGNRL